VTLRNALKLILNTVTCGWRRMSACVISEYARRFGVYDDVLPNYLSYALAPARRR